MFVTRLSFFLGVALLGLSAVRGQETPAAPPAEAPKAVPVVAVPIQPAASPAATATAMAAAKPAATVEPRIVYNSVHVDGPYIAMTFDDGPHKTLTPKLLDLLAQRHIKVTFFVLGECVAENEDVLRRAAREGHEIANHSWSHPQLNRMADDAVRSQLRRTDDLIKSVTGKRPTLFRPPYGALNPRQQRWIHDEFGYSIILWDVDPLDWKEPGPAVVTRRILAETRAGSIVLSHDIHHGTIDAMPAALDQLADKGFKFVTVSELIGLATPVPPKPAPPPASPNEKKRSHAKTAPAAAAPNAPKPAATAPPRN